MATRPDMDLNCKACGVQPHRFQPSTEAGPYWRCSACGEPTPGPEDVERARLDSFFTAAGVEPRPAPRLSPPTGFPELDKVVPSIRRGEVIRLSTPPSPIDRLHANAICSLGLLLHGNEKTDRKAAGEAVAAGIDALALAALARQIDPPTGRPFAIVGTDEAREATDRFKSDSLDFEDIEPGGGSSEIKRGLGIRAEVLLDVVAHRDHLTSQVTELQTSVREAHRLLTVEGTDRDADAADILEGILRSMPGEVAPSPVTDPPETLRGGKAVPILDEETRLEHYACRN